MDKSRNKTNAKQISYILKKTIKSRFEKIKKKMYIKTTKF